MSVTVRLLGTIQITIDAQLARKFHSNKVLALLAYLLTEGVPVPRDRLATLLWDGYTSGAALANLRQALTNLRQVLAPYDLLETTRQTIYLNATHPLLWSDVAIVQQLVTGSRPLTAETWQKLLPTSQREFLYSLPEIDSAPFQAWRAARRVAFRQQIEQLQQKAATRLASPPAAPDATATEPDAPLDQSVHFTVLSQRLQDTRYPFLAMEHEFVVAADRLQVAAMLQPDPVRLRHTLYQRAARPPSIQALLGGAWHSIELTTRTALLRCTVFHGGFTAAAAQQVADLSAESLQRLEETQLLHRLLEESTTIVQRLTAEEPRFRLDEQVRHYAAIQLPPAVAAELQARHAAYYLGWFPATPDVAANAQQAALRLCRDFDNFRRAWQWATEQLALDWLAQGLHTLRYLCSWTDCYLDAAVLLAATVTRFHPHVAESNPAALEHQQLLLKLLKLLALCHRALGQYDQVLQVAEEALRWAVTVADVGSEIECYIDLGSVAYYEGDFSLAHLLFTKALTLAQQHHLLYWQVRSLITLGLIDQERAHYAATLASFEAAADLLSQTSLPGVEEELLKRWSIYYLTIGDFAGATRTLQQYLTSAPRWRNPDLTAIATYNCGLLAFTVGDLARAHSLLLEAHRLALACNNQRVVAVCLSLLAKTLATQGHAHAAEAYCEQALPIAEAGAFVQTICAVHPTLADLRLQAEQWSAAQRLATVVLRLAETHHLPAKLCAAHATLALAHCRLDEATVARFHLEAALAAVVTLPPLHAPQQILFRCYQVLTLLNDERTPAILQQAWAYVQTQVATISDDNQQRSFLNNVPVHRLLAQLLAQG